MKRFLACLAVVAFVLMSCSAPPTEQQPPPEDASPSSWRHKERCRHRSYRHSRRLCRRGPLPSTTTTTTRPPRSTTTTTTAPPRTTTTTTTTPPSTTTPDPGQGQPVGPSGNFRLAWSDEFNGSRLDTSKWRPNWLGGSDSAVTPPVNSLELSCYDPGHVRVSGGLLHLTADTNTPSGCRTRNGSARYASGLVQTNGRYNFTYGYVEARINIPGTCSRGENWPAFWTNGQSWPRDGEIDIMEVLGGSATWHYHWGGGSAGGRGDHLSCESGWHTFGVLWEPGRLTFYYDGRQVGSHTRGVVSTRHYIILNHALSSEISPPVVVPSTLQVDWVRHWVRQ